MLATVNLSVGGLKTTKGVIGYIRNKIMVGRAGLQRIGANILKNQP